MGLTKIGRGEGNDVKVDDLKVSRFHAELHLIEKVLEVVDLGSTNGTFFNGKRLIPHQPQHIAAGDEIIFGKTKFICDS
jgi:pSer/pThr/pTyr-binding forkhead associated (FHA) protein